MLALAKNLRTGDQILIKSKVTLILLCLIVFSCVHMTFFVSLNKLNAISINLFERMCSNFLPSVTKEAWFWFLKRCPVSLHSPMVTGALRIGWLHKVGDHPCDVISEGPVGLPSAYHWLSWKNYSFGSRRLSIFKSSQIKWYASNYHWCYFRLATLTPSAFYRTQVPNANRSYMKRSFCDEITLGSYDR